MRPHRLGGLGKFSTNVALPKLVRSKIAVFQAAASADSTVDVVVVTVIFALESFDHCLFSGPGTLVISAIELVGRRALRRVPVEGKDRQHV